MPSTPSTGFTALQATAHGRQRPIHRTPRMRGAVALCAVLSLLALAGCSSTTPYQGTDTSASGHPSTGSGVQVFGTIDAGVVHHR